MNSRWVAPLLSIADQGVSASVGFVATVYVGRFLGPAELGVFAVLGVVILVLNGVQNGLILQGLAVLGPRLSSAESTQYLGSIFWLDRSLALVLALGGVFVSLVMGRILHWDHGTTAACVASLGYFFFVSLQNLIRRQLYIEHKPGSAFAQSFFFVALVLGGLASLSLLGAATVARVYLVLATGSLIICATQSRVWNLLSLRPGFDRIRAAFLQHWGFGRWILLSIPFVVGTYQGYYFLVGLMLSWADVGVLRGADVLILPFEQALIGLTLFFTPHAAETLPALDVHAQKRWCARQTAALTGMGLAYALAMYFFGGALVSGVFGSSLSASARVLPILALLPILQSLAVPANIALMSLLMPARNLASRVAATAATAIGGVILILSLGVPGAAFGLVISAATFTAGLWIGLFQYWKKQAGRPRADAFSG